MNSKLFTLHFSLLISLLFLSSCRQQAAKAYVTELDSNDSLSILMGNSEKTRYHSDKLDIDITYPSFLRHQYLEEDQMEVFMDEDVSLSYMVEHLDDNLHRSPGQTRRFGILWQSDRRQSSFHYRHPALSSPPCPSRRTPQATRPRLRGIKELAFA